jgi:DNA-binding transcriptional LysR family regulator
MVFVFLTEQQENSANPGDIVAHNGIYFTFDKANKLAPWTFEEEASPIYSVMPKTQMVINNLTSMINLAKSGVGIAYIYKRIATPFIESGELVSLFDEHMPDLPRYTINYLSKHQMTKRLRAFIDLVKGG